ncbi:MAG: hypothetical protein AB7E47_05795 [Desulfovibrionaceae bacterium]
MLTEEELFKIIDDTLSQRPSNKLLLLKQLPSFLWDEHYYDFQIHLCSLVKQEVFSEHNKGIIARHGLSKGAKYYSYAKKWEARPVSVNVNGSGNNVQVGNHNTMTINQNDAETIERTIRALVEQKDPGLVAKVQELWEAGLSGIEFVSKICSLFA